MAQNLQLLQRQIQGLECSVCEQFVDANDVVAGSLGFLLLRLKSERFALCPSCTQGVSRELQHDSAYQQRWNELVREMITVFKDGARSYRFWK